MPHLLARFALVLVAGLATGCSTTSTPPPSVGPAATTASPSASAPGHVVPSTPSRSAIALPAPKVLSGRNVVKAFDAATDGSAIAWSSLPAGADPAPELWSFDEASGRSRLVFRSAIRGAVLANLAVRNGMHAFAEIVPATVTGVAGSGVWRLKVLDGGRVHDLDTDQPPEFDPPESGRALLPMTALSDRGILWAASHANGLGDPTCLLQYASFDDFMPRVIGSAPCLETEFWYPRSDGRRFVYGTLEYGPDRSRDDRRVYVLSDADPTPRRLGDSAQASLPDILGDTVIWKTADPYWNMLSFGELVEYSATTGDARTLPFLAPAPGDGRLTTPTIGRAFYAADNEDPGSVEVWDRAGQRAIRVDRLDPADPGFLSNVRLSGDLLFWFYTGDVGGGGDREIRWLNLGAAAR